MDIGLHLQTITRIPGTDMIDSEVYNTNATHGYLWNTVDVNEFIRISILLSLVLRQSVKWLTSCEILNQDNLNFAFEEKYRNK